MNAHNFVGQQQLLCLEDYFAGRCRAWGVFIDRFGKARRQFEVDIHGAWDGETLTLVEDFIYDDGEMEQRTWHIRKVGAQAYEGRADGVIGTAKGIVQGGALNWTYRFALAVGGRTLNVRFNDWLFLQRDGIMLNRAEVTKFGVLLGEVMLFFRKLTVKDENERTVSSPHSSSSMQGSSPGIGCSRLSEAGFSIAHSPGGQPLRSPSTP